jgi:tetratricopeptide (TPR) repeat protein
MGYWREEQWDSAAKELTTAITIEPGYAEAWLSRSYVYFARGTKYIKHDVEKGNAAGWKAAIHDWRHAFLLEPMVDLTAIGPIEIGETPRLGGEVGALFKEYHPWWMDSLAGGILAMQEGRYLDARKQLQGVMDDPRFGMLSSTPDLVVFYHGLASAHSGDFRAAIDDFTALKVRIENKVKFWRGPPVGFPPNELNYLIATSAWRGGFANEAIDGYHQVLRADFSLYMAHVQLAAIYSAGAAWDQAILEARSALDVNPDDPSLLLNLGRIYFKAGRPQDAEDAFDQAARLNPRNALAPYLLGETLEKLDKMEEAKEAYRRFLAIAPSSYAAQCDELRKRLSL